MNNTSEHWKPIEEFSSTYVISSHGTIKCLKNKKLLTVKPRVDRAGYQTVRFTHIGQTHTRYVHRLVAAAFVPNNLNKQLVNHRNGNKLDNRPKNLEWVTHAENIQHAHDLRLIPRPTEKKVIDTISNIIYPSIKEASKQTGLPYPTIKGYLKGTRRNKTSLRYLNN